MPIRFLCPACRQLLSIASRKAGHQVECPKCRATIIVPDGPESTTDNSSSATPLLHRPAQQRAADDSQIVISRRTLYLQAALLAIVAIVAFVSGYLIGGGK